MKNIMVLGGDGFCGWPVALFLSEKGYEVTIVDNLSRRKIDNNYHFNSLTPIASLEDRVSVWNSLSAHKIKFNIIDIVKEREIFEDLLLRVKPDVIIHFAEQRSAPFSMKSDVERVYTVENNIGSTHHLLSSLVKLDIDAHIIHLGTMGVYGYSSTEWEIPEGYLSVQVEGRSGKYTEREILYPTSPGSVYHLTKSMDQLVFQYYASNYQLRITDLHQGVVWGTNTKQTNRDERLINRFDYDGDYGTVLNRFLMQSAIGHPLTVYGTGGQTRAFIHIDDTCKCIELAIENPAKSGERVKIFNQVTETHTVLSLAKKVSEATGVSIQPTENPRNEMVENELDVCHECFDGLGLKAKKVADAPLNTEIELAVKYIDRVDKSIIKPLSFWKSK